MRDTKLLLELSEKYSFVFLIRQEDDDKWEGEVWRCPHPIQQKTGNGLACGTTRRAESEKELKGQLDSIMNEYDR